jgi:DNA-directed RNA polymerase specialized sigma24 family protein
VSSRSTNRLVRADAAVARAWRKLRRPLKRLARSLTDDLDLREDMMQEAMIALWERDPTRFDLRDQRDLMYVRRGLANRMYDVWRAEQGRSVECAVAYGAASSSGTAVVGLHPDYCR